MIGLIFGPLAVAFVVGLIPTVPPLAQQIVWIAAILLAGGAALWDWRRREAAKRERARLHEQRMAQRRAAGDAPRAQARGPRETSTAPESADRSDSQA